MGHARISGNVVRLHSAKPVGPVHAALATATGDATIRVLYLIDDDPPTWVDVSGARRDPVEPSDARSSTTVELDGAVIAAVEHAAETAPERIESACEALAADIEQEQRIACLCAQVRVLEGAEQRLRDVFDAVELVVAAMDLDALHDVRQPLHGAPLGLDARRARRPELVRDVPKRARVLPRSRPGG